MADSNSNVYSFSLPGEKPISPEQEDLNTLATLIKKFATHDGHFSLGIPGVYLRRISTTTHISEKITAKSGICIVASGAKAVNLGQKKYSYDESRMVVYAADVPINTQIISAVPDRPFLCIVIEMDHKLLGDLIVKAYPEGVPKIKEPEAIYVGNSNPKIVKSAVRLLEILSQNEDVDLLGPLAIEEILVRLLRSSAGPYIAQVGVTDSNAQKIIRSINWLKSNFHETVKVEELAEISNMSSSSFYNYFKSLTSMSPLQYQKLLRLEAARSLLINQGLDVSTACYKVGYSSVSQFSREYSRQFGHPPSKDTSRK